MSGPGLIIKGAIIGCILVLLLTLFATANVASAGIVTDDEMGIPVSRKTSNKAPVDPQKKGSKPVNNQQSKDKQAAPPKNKRTKNHTKCEVSDVFPASILQWCELITDYGHQRNLPPDLIAAVMLQESGGDAQAYSHSGAVGLLQVMPHDGLAANFMCQNGPCFSKRPSMKELYDPKFNIEYGTGMLANLKGKYGNYRDALKAYGPGDMGYVYADKVLAIYERYGN